MMYNPVFYSCFHVICSSKIGRDVCTRFYTAGCDCPVVSEGNMEMQYNHCKLQLLLDVIVEPNPPKWQYCCYQLQFKTSDDGRR